jgi:hypothetical protein
MVKALRPMPGMQILLMMPISHQEANDLSFYGGLSPFSWTRALEASFTSKSVRSISFM